ncbi:MAG: ABC-F family ATP-binding cassette domain-containing protein [Euryarchaeota archaeon]|nr:ABC-F family ATP-binding cassette domain-containing protein [Euryarchaeota archaeon]
MARPLARFVEVDKAYGGRRLFENATFQIEAGEHIAVVGPNGAGKSTLLKILTGRDRVDHGLVEIDESVRTHWFDQHPVVPPGATVQDILGASAAVPPAIAAELAELEAQIADPDLYTRPGYETVLERFAELQQRAKRESTSPGGIEEHSIVEALGIDDAFLGRSVKDLSGGQRTRVFLARLLAGVHEGDLVVLDEPTNHLDVETIEWLEDHLRRFDGTVLIVAHDRAFLDAVAERVFEVDRNAVSTYWGNYEDFVSLRTQNRDRVARERDRMEREARQAQEVVQQFRHQKRFDGQMAARLKVLEKYQEKLARAPDPLVERHTMDLRFDSGGGSTQVIIAVQGLRKSYGSQPVILGADLDVTKGERIGLVGPNGSGKSTLLKILSGKLPKDDGTVRIPPGVKGAYYSQDRDDLDVNRTLRDEVLLARPKLEDEDIKALLGRFRFQPDADLPRKVGTLSGGERARIALLKTVLKPANLLLLDEPTNHLDLESREVLAGALNAFKGAILIASHDRWLLDSVTSKTALMDRGKIRVLPGSFTETRSVTATAKPPGPHRDKYIVREGFKDPTTGARHWFGKELELTPEELEENPTLRRALLFGRLERVE